MTWTTRAYPIAREWREVLSAPKSEPKRCQFPRLTEDDLLAGYSGMAHISGTGNLQSGDISCRQTADYAYSHQIVQNATGSTLVERAAGLPKTNPDAAGADLTGRC